MVKGYDKEYNFALFVGIICFGVIFFGFLFSLGVKLAGLVFGGF